MTAETSLGTKTSVPVDYGAEAFVEMLNANGVEYVFINSGSDTVAIQEAMAKFVSLGRRVPRAIVCPDEATAVAAAHGHFMISRKPQVVLVHVDAGTLQFGGNIHNAQRGRAGMILCAGRAPMTFDGEMAGTRDLWIHWTQEQRDQAGILRNFTKWDYEVRRTDSIQHVLQRGFQLASSEPPAPIYITLPREVLMERVSEVKVPDVNRHGPVTTPQADFAAINRAAELLAKARSPLILTAQSGRNQSSVSAIIELSELIAAPVVSQQVYMNFPTTHPMWAGVNPQPYLSDADVLLVIDQDVPYIPIHGRPRQDAQIIHIDIDPVKPTIPLWVFPADLLIHADSAKALPALVDSVSSVLTEAHRARIDERFGVIKAHAQNLKAEAVQLALSHSTRQPITPEWLSYCINQVIDEDTIFLDECVSNSVGLTTYLQRSVPGTFYKSGGSSLGWGLGAALGAKLAQPDKTVVTAVGDGTFIYGCPTSSLWAADVHGAPFLTVIYNNQVHYASKSTLIKGYPDSYASKTNNWVGLELSPSVDFAMLAQACRCYGEMVEQPGEVKPALERALEQVKAGRPAVLDVRIERP